MKILSIDPGYERLGIAIIEKEKKGAIEKHIFSETFHTSKKLEFRERLFLLGERIEQIIEEFSPNALAIEKLFFNTNQKTATNVAETRGVIIYLAMKNKMEVYEYTPLEIKMALTGNGRADKKQVIFMVKQLIKINKSDQKEIAQSIDKKNSPEKTKEKEKEIKILDDEYDAIAVGLTCFAYIKNF